MEIGKIVVLVVVVFVLDVKMVDFDVLCMCLLDVVKMIKMLKIG